MVRLFMSQIVQSRMERITSLYTRINECKCKIACFAECRATIMMRTLNWEFEVQYVVTQIT